MGYSDLDPDLDAAVARGPVRQWMDRASAELLLEVERVTPPAHVWQALSDDKVRPTHRKANGQAIPANLRFILDRPERGPTVRGQAEHAAHRAEGHHGGRTGNIARKPEQFGTEQGRFPRDPALSPGNKINCRCHLVTVAGMIAATMIADPVEVAGTLVTATIWSDFPRIAESEFGDGQDPGLHFMAGALNAFASRLQASAAR